MNKTPDHLRAERGNVLWFILLAVALLAALTMVLSRGSSSTDQSADFEQQSVKISQMLRFAKGLEAAVQDMRLRGVSENNISFWHDSNGDGTENSSDTYYNAGCTVGDCHLFTVGGSGLDYAVPPSGVNDGSNWVFIGTNDVSGIGTTAPDLIILLRDIKTETRETINRLLGTSFAGDSAIIDYTEFTGTFTASAAIDNAAGQEAGCVSVSTGGAPENTFYAVLIKR